jgi:hypothetical protein
VNYLATEELAREFNAVLTVEKRFLRTSLFRLALNGVTMAGPCESEAALELLCHELLHIMHPHRAVGKRLP